MLPKTIFFLLMSTLYATKMNVFAELCSKTLYCACIASDYSKNYYYKCKNINENIEVDLFGTTEEIKITCRHDNTSKEWPELFKNVNLSRNNAYELLTIQNCTIPDKSIKYILDQLSVKKIRTLSIDFTTGPKNNYQAHHFQGLNFVESFYFRRNEGTTFSDNALVGLRNVTILILEGNYLQKISPIFFQNVSKLEFLDLSGNNLTKLEWDTFKHVMQLRTLRLSGNKLRNLSREVFTPLRNLTVLDLSGNKIRTFNEDIFRDLPRLKDLNLNFNNIKILPERIFNGLNSLESFIAIRSFNEIVKTIPSGLFSGLKSLRSIKIEENELTHLPDSSIFSGLTALKDVSLAKNRLTELPPDLFQTTVNLTKINLSENRLTSLNESLFRGLQELVTLNLKLNKLSFIHEHAFNDLLSLETLDLSSNKLSHLQDDVFHQLANLHVIYLDDNQLDMRKYGSAGDQSVLSNCKNLAEVHLKNNSVDHIFRDWYTVLNSLNLLDLSHNRLETLPSINIRQFIVDHLYINLDDNNITLFNFKDYEPTIEALSSYCPNTECQKKRQKFEISLRNNIINCDCRNYDFIRLIQGRMSSEVLKFMSIEGKDKLVCYQPESMFKVKLLAVDLADLYCVTACPKNCTCQSYTQSRVTVVNCTNVDKLPTWLPNNTEVELILAQNKLENLLNVSRLIHYSNVTKLSLSGNCLKNIDDLNIPPLLKELKLDSNQLSVLSENSVKKLNQTRANISLHGNPWKCDCASDAQYSLHFIRYLILESLILYKDNITCNTTYEGQSMVHLFENGLICSKFNYLSIISLTSAFFGILFGILAILYLQYKLEIKVYLYSRKIFRWLVFKKEVDCDKEYDAFISYAHQDEAFVAEHLLGKLENGPHHQYKLCLLYRDWLIGDSIPEKIVRSVESSRRTVVLVTQSYLESAWNNLSFTLAYQHQAQVQHQRLIVILLEEVDLSAVDNLCPHLRTYIETKAYLKWKSGSKFWEKLYYNLPHQEA